MREGHAVLLEYLLSDPVPALDNKVVKALFLLQTLILFFIKAARCALQVIFEEEITYF